MVFPRIDIDVFGVPHVLAVDIMATAAATYHVRAGAVWLEEEIVADPNVGLADMAVADNGTVHVVYPVDGGAGAGVYLTSRNPVTGWWSAPSQIDARDSFVCQVALVQGRLHVAAMVDEPALATGVIAYARGPGWTVSDVAASNNFDWFDLAVDESGTTHIVYYDMGIPSTHYLAGRDYGTGWTETVAVEQIAASPDHVYPSLSTGDGRVRVYGISGSDELMVYERDADDVWTGFVLDPDAQTPIPFVAGTHSDALGDQIVYWHNTGANYVLRHVVGPVGRRP